MIVTAIKRAQKRFIDREISHKEHKETAQRLFYQVFMMRTIIVVLLCCLAMVFFPSKQKKLTAQNLTEYMTQSHPKDKSFLSREDLEGIAKSHLKSLFELLEKGFFQ